MLCFLHLQQISTFTGHPNDDDGLVVVVVVAVVVAEVVSVGAEIAHAQFGANVAIGAVVATGVIVSVLDVVATTCGEMDDTLDDLVCGKGLSHGRSTPSPKIITRGSPSG